jgi:hypothetical protein
MNTAGTKAVVGFAQGQRCALGEVTLVPESRFAALYVTAAEKDGQIAGSKRLIVVALARARNTGMKFSPGGDELLEKGKGPVLMEPVKAGISLRRTGTIRVTALDHDGRRTEKTLPVADGAFVVDTGRDQTPYYLVEVD